ncbi:hypothetical protein ACWCOV_00355 [Kribbella sp. NPDC002412]
MSVEDPSNELARDLAAARGRNLSTEGVIAELRCGEFLSTYLGQVQSGSVETWLETLTLDAPPAAKTPDGRS